MTSDTKEPRRYPFESWAWDDDLTNNNRWCDASDAESAYDRLKAAFDVLEKALCEIRSNSPFMRGASFMTQSERMSQMAQEALAEARKILEGK